MNFQIAFQISFQNRIPDIIAKSCSDHSILGNMQFGLPQHFLPLCNSDCPRNVRCNLQGASQGSEPLQPNNPDQYYSRKYESQGQAWLGNKHIRVRGCPAWDISSLDAVRTGLPDFQDCSGPGACAYRGFPRFTTGTNINKHFRTQKIHYFHEEEMRHVAKPVPLGRGEHQEPHALGPGKRPQGGGVML